MSRIYRRSIPHYRPVSQKAYDTFVRYIYAVVPKDNRCADMIDALDKYLDGDRDNYASHLDEHTAITFEMLRFEIDKAIERSARARRPRHRKVEPVNPVPEVTAQAKDKIPVRKKKCPKKAKKSLSDNETLSPALIKGIFTVLSSRYRPRKNLCRKFRIIRLSKTPQRMTPSHLCFRCCPAACVGPRSLPCVPAINGVR